MEEICNIHIFGREHYLGRMEINENFNELKMEILNVKSQVKEIREMVAILLRTNMPDKLKLLEEAVKTNKKMETWQVIKLLGCSKPWALKLMKELSDKQLFFRYVDGDKIMQMPSRIVYLEEKKFTTDLIKVGGFVETANAPVTLAILADVLELDISIYCDYIKVIIEHLAKEYSDEYELIEGNKIKYIQCPQN